jgi:predicted DNA-binding transcriptional regulator AlpA
MESLVYSTSELLQVLGIARGTLFKLVREKRFPAPKKLGAKNVWSKKIVRDWLEDEEGLREAKG